MKKTIVASAITLSVLGLTSPTFADDSKVVNLLTETTISEITTETTQVTELPTSEEQTNTQPRSTTTTSSPASTKLKEKTKVAEAKKMDG